MEKNSVWYLAGICLIGVVIGIIFVGVLTSVVHLTITWQGKVRRQILPFDGRHLCRL